MDEYFKFDVGVDFEGFRNSGVEFGKGICVFILYIIIIMIKYILYGIIVY